MFARSLCLYAALALPAFVLPTLVGCAQEEGVSSDDTASEDTASEESDEGLTDEPMVEVADDVWAPADQADLFYAVRAEHDLAVAEGRAPRDQADILAGALGVSREDVIITYDYLRCTGSGGGTTTWSRCTGNAADTCRATLSATLSYKEPLDGIGTWIDSASVNLALTNSTTTAASSVTMLSVNGTGSVNVGSSPVASASGHVYPSRTGSRSITGSGAASTPASGSAGIDPWAGGYTVSTNSLEFLYYKSTGNVAARQSTSFPVSLTCRYMN